MTRAASHDSRNGVVPPFGETRERLDLYPARQREVAVDPADPPESMLPLCRGPPPSRVLLRDSQLRAADQAGIERRSRRHEHGDALPAATDGHFRRPREPPVPRLEGVEDGGRDLLRRVQVVPSARELLDRLHVHPPGRSRALLRVRDPLREIDPRELGERVRARRDLHDAAVPGRGREAQLERDPLSDRDGADARAPRNVMISRLCPEARAGGGDPERRQSELASLGARIRAQGEAESLAAHPRPERRIGAPVEAPGPVVAIWARACAPRTEVARPEGALGRSRYDHLGAISRRRSRLEPLHSSGIGGSAESTSARRIPTCVVSRRRARASCLHGASTTSAEGARLPDARRQAPRRRPQAAR